MRSFLRAYTALLMSFACISSALAAPAQAGKKVTTTQSARYAAIEKCSQQARAQAPGGTYGQDEVGKARTLIYKSCMSKLGFGP
jgi:cytochrome bd-type quinol oxidase subunit 1